jgi:hypothetical protein
MSLVFHAGDYLRGAGERLPDPAFFDVIPIRFGIADTGAHYHVPLVDLGLWLRDLSRQLSGASKIYHGAILSQAGHYGPNGAITDCRAPKRSGRPGSANLDKAWRSGWGLPGKSESRVAVHPCSRDFLKQTL